MKMTISEALSIPKSMNFEEYGKILEKKKKIQTSIRNLSIKIEDQECSLEVLSDEIGSERYNRHLQEKQKYESKRLKLQEELTIIEKQLIQ